MQTTNQINQSNKYIRRGHAFCSALELRASYVRHWGYNCQVNQRDITLIISRSHRNNMSGVSVIILAQTFSENRQPGSQSAFWLSGTALISMTRIHWGNGCCYAVSSRLTLANFKISFKCVQNVTATWRSKELARRGSVVEPRRKRVWEM